MKVYVRDNDMVRNCYECPCYDGEYYFCNALRENTNEDYKKLTFDKQQEWDEQHDYDLWEEHNKLKDCPFESLTDYTKQVRNEVCEEIKEKSELFGVCKTGILKKEYRIDKDVLDQIQGVENE